LLLLLFFFTISSLYFFFKFIHLFGYPSRKCVIVSVQCSSEPHDAAEVLASEQFLAVRRILSFLCLGRLDQGRSRTSWSIYCQQILQLVLERPWPRLEQAYLLN